MQEPISIATFRQRVSPHNPALTAEMGYLAGSDVVAEEFTAYCNAYADGLDYVFQRFGSAPSEIVIQDTTGVWLDDPNSLAVARSDIAWAVENQLVKTPHSDPFILNQDQAAYVKGVADAHTLFCQQKLAEMGMEQRLTQGQEAEFAQNIAPLLELDMETYDTGYVVRMVLLEKGWNKATSMAQARPKPRPASKPKSWASSLKKKDELEQQFPSHLQNKPDRS